MTRACMTRGSKFGHDQTPSLYSDQSPSRARGYNRVAAARAACVSTWLGEPSLALAGASDCAACSVSEMLAWGPRLERNVRVKRNRTSPVIM